MALARLLFLLTVFSIVWTTKSQAEETDQFSLPPVELADIGPYASNQLVQVLKQVMNQTNAEIQMLLPRSKQSRNAAAKLALRLKGDYLADLVYQKTGPGFPRWFRWEDLYSQAKPFRYREIWPWKTIYWLVFSQSPVSLIGLAPTINMYGYYFGTDKLGHFFMLGHSYYKIYSYLLAHGKSPKQARAAIIFYGQFIEQTYLGTMINGVYSNADLSANYAGWKFYMNLTRTVRVGTHKLSPIFVLNGNQWQFNKLHKEGHLLKPYLSDNLNEAWNPSHYAFMRSQIQRQVMKRCTDWIQRRSINPGVVEAKLRETNHWHGEDYGHWLPAKHAVTLNVCFQDK
ncbi:hypothetical protein [Legionella jordanis]|uniref:Uncharacterized protein n=1 Tax=Legionella jordanis TaxID=456 RepID=A0A0W0VAF7_9GAMM|nr:hypothetical protein [Legionella jordanis]KTD17082.1 hypothetical protein Ljor_1388 [Legionella jordanis]RMX03215.1 hypothetical protein EAW55_07240 [Legionella jordanis]RMX18645.1 hypothetical protein EAS68_07455 [Legionella jordanis]VEH12721.1 Uncharacterised protein [Legionella jordanis]HAT8713130.1 hypothetical protein [Legionella jordanis]